MTIIELKNGRPRLREVSASLIDTLKDEPSFYGEIVRITGMGADVRRPDGKVERFAI